MPSAEENIYARVFPEVRAAILESSKHQNRTYAIVLSFRQGTSNIDIKVFSTKTLPLMNVYTGVEETPKTIFREESMEEVKIKLKKDVEKIFNEHSDERGKTALTINIKEGAYMSAEFYATEYRYESTKQSNKSAERKKLSFDVK